ncbi:MAG: tRNA 2-thiouridine(34) synthase MnmA [Patescibacteria group bacterium]
MSPKKARLEQIQRVYVAMSGGVDSSVAVALLKKQGFDVYGVFMQGWMNPRFECAWKEDRQDAARVASILDIPFRTLDFSREYYERVISYLINEYKSGRTPNPDVMCNKEIKFGLFYKWAMTQGADYIATGHYAKKEGDGLFIAKDKNKDQTYFLWTLTPEIISHTLFPIGEYTKPKIRECARAFRLPTAEKKDSQGVCFVGEGSMEDFLKDHIATTKGDIMTSSGKKVGEHDGLAYYTIGQRHGIGVAGGGAVYYVAKKDSKTSTLIVAEGENDPILYKKEISFHSANWLSVKHPMFDKLFECEARIRYRAPLAQCTVFLDVGRLSGRVVFDPPQRAIAPGQSIVFYKNDQMLGGGVID